MQVSLLLNPLQYQVVFGLNKYLLNEGIEYLWHSVHTHHQLGCNFLGELWIDCVPVKMQHPN